MPQAHVLLEESRGRMTVVSEAICGAAWILCASRINISNLATFPLDTPRKQRTPWSLNERINKHEQHLYINGKPICVSFREQNVMHAATHDQPFQMRNATRRD